MLQRICTDGNFTRLKVTGHEVWVSTEKISEHCSGLHAGVEESVNVDDVLKEAPLGLGAGLGLDVVLDGLVNLGFVLGLDLDSLNIGGKGGNEGDGDGSEHL